MGRGRDDKDRQLLLSPESDKTQSLTHKIQPGDSQPDSHQKGKPRVEVEEGRDKGRQLQCR